MQTQSTESLPVYEDKPDLLCAIVAYGSVFLCGLLLVGVVALQVLALILLPLK